MYYITTSRPYTNASPHLGTVMDPIYADVYKRFNFLAGNNPFFSMGTDEHSFKIAESAVALNLLPQEFANNKYAEFEEVFKNLHISSDNFIQSSDKKHHFIANLVWKRLEKKNFIYKKKYNGLYCKGCEDFYAPSQLINGKCPIHINLEIQNVDEENYFFKLSAFKDRIIDYIKTVKINNEDYKKEMINFCSELKDISISRDKSRLGVEWGITVNSDPSNVMYVWFEALITYITPLVSDDLYENWLEGDEDLKNTIEAEIFAEINEKMPQNLQVIGSDNTKFHMVIWPGILFALDLPPIENFIDHGMILDQNGRKFAKSLGNGVSFEYLYNLMGENGVRFFVLYYCNSGGDTAFGLNSLIEQYNSNLVNNLGNVVLRITTLTEKYFEGDLNFDRFSFDPESLEKINKEFEAEIVLNESIIYQYLQILKPELALRELFSQISQINAYLEKTKPWTLAKKIETKKVKEEIRLILCYCLFNLYKYTEILSLFLPSASASILNDLDKFPLAKGAPLFSKIELVEKI